MSLRFKIILLFVGLAILPMLILAGFSYWQARGLLVEMAQANLHQTTNRLSEALAERGAEVEEGLRLIASSPEFRQLGSGDPGEFGSREMVPPALRGAQYLEVLRPDGFSRIVAGTEPASEIRMESSENSALLLFSSELPRSQGAGSFRAAFWAGDLLSDERMDPGSSVYLLDAATGRILLRRGTGGPDVGAGLNALPRFAEAISSAEESFGQFQYRAEDGSRLGAVSFLSDRSLAVVATSRSGTMLSALNRLVGSYWAFVIGLAVFTGLAFSILIGRFTRSLTDLAEAAEQIGKGELAPWLPLPTSGEVGQLTLAFNRMLERIREMMTQVDQSGRLAVVGQLSAYFAHEIRNPLTSVKLNLQRMDRWARLGKVPEFCMEPIEISLREVERLSASVQDVLQLSRSEEAVPEPFSLHDLVADSTHLLQSRFERQGVGLRLDLDAEADRVLARPGQVKSVVLNLMINALEAQPGGGFLEISSELIRSQGFNGPVVAVRFKDGGPGIPPEIRGRVFEPFFTTKPNGSGIGLAVASRAVADNHGRLYLEPAFTDKGGAEFVMAFPLAPVELEGMRAGDALSSVQAPDWTGRDWWEGIPLAPFDKGERDLPGPLLTPDGIEAVMALSRRDPEEIN